MSRWTERRGTKARGFTYVDADGRRVRRAEQLARIDRLRIPPAWTTVHIAASAASEIQAWGLDSRGRKQYRYHEKAVERGQRRKYYRVRQLGHDLPSIRRVADRELRKHDLSRDCVAAAAIRLLSEAFFRVGSERYERENKTFGLTTLRKSHVSLEGGCVVFSYRGKGSIRQRQVVVDKDLAAFVRRLRRSPGKRLFRYRDGDEWRDLSSTDVNEYLRGLAGRRYTAKDFRTWGGTLRLATVLCDLGAAEGEREAKKNATMALRFVAAELGNTPATCRSSYVHPMLIARYVDDGETISLEGRSQRNRTHAAHSPEERALLRFLDEHFPERRRRKMTKGRGTKGERRETSAETDASR